MADPLTKKSRKPGQMSLPAKLLVGLVFFGPAAYAVWQGDAILAAALGIIGMAGFIGHRMGAANLFGSFLAIGIAIWLAPSIGYAQEHRFAEWFGTSGLTNRILTVGTIGVVISLLVSITMIIAAGLFFAKRPRWETANHGLGFVIGIVEGGLAVLLLFGGLLVLEPGQRERAANAELLDVRSRFVSKAVLTTCDAIHRSALGPKISQYNPFLHVPQLKQIEKVQQTAQVLSARDGINDLLGHPAIRTLQERPEVRQTVERLQSDPKIKAILESENGITRSDLRTLMDHPAVLELLDHPGFVREAAKVIEEATNPETLHDSLPVASGP